MPLSSIICIILSIITIIIIIMISSSSSSSSRSSSCSSCSIVMIIIIIIIIIISSSNNTSIIIIIIIIIIITKGPELAVERLAADPPRREGREALRSVFIISNREISNWESQILKTSMSLMCPYCLRFQIARV